MDRMTVYPGAVPLETDLLKTNKFALVGLSKLAAADLGTNTQCNGLVCTQQTVPNLSVQISPGEIYQLGTLDANAYSSLGIDSHQVLKQGILMDSATLTGFAAPATVGQSINYLIQAQYADSDGQSALLPYFNSANPNQVYWGQNNSGVQQPTARQGVVNLQVKAGVSAATGSQTTPAADAGFVGLWVVTVAYGQVVVTNANISLLPTAPYLYQPLSEWQAGLVYPAGAMMQRNGVTYQSLQASIGQDPATQTAYWQRWGYTAAQIATMAPDQNKLYYLGQA